MAEGWSFKAFGSEFGPLPLEDVLKAARRGTLQPADLVRSQPAGEWLPARDYAELAEVFATAATPFAAPAEPPVEHSLSTEPVAVTTALPETRAESASAAAPRRPKFRRRVINNIPEERGFPWLEALLVVSGAALFFQIFPDAWWSLVSALDVRNWSRSTMLIANVVGVAVLFVIMTIQKNRAPK